MRFERLSALDAAFLTFETPTTPMHIGAVGVFDAGPLAKAGGGIDHERIARHVASRLHLLPCYRKRLAFTPIGAPGWVDDEHFDLGFQVRSAALPSPGSETALKELVARIFSQPLDRRRPLWELWTIEGVAGGRFAMVIKVHHCMVDGIAGVNMLSLLFATTPDEKLEEPEPWTPTPAPATLEFLLDEATRRTRLGAALATDALRALQAPRATWSSLRNTAGAFAQAVQQMGHRAAPTRLNGTTSPHRRFEWVSLDLEAMKMVKRALGGTVNDVMLTTLAGAIGRFLDRDGSLPAGLDYRIHVPVSMRAPGATSASGNRVSMLLVSLPIAERDPTRRYAAVRARMEQAKSSRAAEGVDLVTRFTDRTGAVGVGRLTAIVLSQLQPCHLVVTNVPGPTFPLWMLGARLVELIPTVPLFTGHGIGIAVLSYFGRMAIGLLADRDLVPDLDALPGAIGESFEELVKLAGVGVAKPGRRRSGSSEKQAGNVLAQSSGVRSSPK